MIEGDQHHITFDTELMVGMSISFLEHDLHHDLHPGYKGEDRAVQYFSGSPQADREFLSGDMTSGLISPGILEDNGKMELGGGTNIQKGGLIPGVTQGEEDDINNRVQQMKKLFSTYTTQINSIKSEIKGIEEYLDGNNLKAMEPVFAQIDQRNKQIEELKKELQMNIVNQVTSGVPNRWIRIKILLLFSERFSKEYKILLGNIFDENTFNEITTEILLHQIVDELNPSDSQQIPRPRGRQQLYISQITRSGLGYFVYILYNCDEDSVIFLNNEIIDSTSYQKTIYQNTNPPQIHYSFHSNLLGLDLVLIVYLPPELCTATSTLHLQLQLPGGVSVDFMNPSVKWLFEDESRYNILQEHQTIFCNYLLHVQNSQDEVYNEQKSYLGMSGGIGGKTSSFSLYKEVSSSIFNYIVALNVIAEKIATGRRASKQKTYEMIPVSIAESLGEENELCYHNFASCINPTLMHGLFPEASQLEGFPIENIFIGQLLNTDNFVPWFPDNNIPLVDDNTNINKTSQFCNFIGKIVSVLENYLSAGDGEQVKISLQQLLTLFETVTPREKEMIFENGNQNFNQEVKIGYMLNVLQLVVILYYYLYQDDNFKTVREYLETTMQFTQDNITKLFEYMHTIFNNFYTTYCGYITEILGSKKTLTGQQKLNITFFVCIASASFRYSLNRLLDSDQTLKGSVIQKEFIKKNYDMMAKTIDPEQISKMTPGGNIDDLTWTNIIKFISSGTTRFEGNSNYLLKKGIKNNSNFLQELVNSEETSEALKNIALRFETMAQANPQQKFYIPNAVNAAGKMGILQGNHMCNIAAVMDAQPFCSSTLEALKNGDGLEWGSFKVNISDAQNPNSLAGSTMIYRLQVELKSNSKGWPVEAEIKVYYQIGDKNLINIGTVPIAGSKGDDSLKVSLTGGNTPLKAVECFKSLGAVCMGIVNTNFSGNLKSFLESVMTEDSDRMDKIRQRVCNKSVRKSLGDVLIELTGVTENGGYVPGEGITGWKYAGANIVKPNDGRLTLSNDKPSGGRLLMYILYGKSGINPNCMGGFINNSGAFGVAFRGEPIGMRAGRKTKRKKNKKSKIKMKSKKGKKQMKRKSQKKRK
jgi:hypothetical protein